MLPILHLGCTALMGTNKVGELKPDAQGYYRVVLGALEYPNSVGATYKLEAAKKLFEDKSSSFMRQIKAGNLRGELGHPKPDYSRPMSEYLARTLAIEETNISHHIRNVWIDVNAVDSHGKPFVAIYGDVKPCGEKGKYLKEILDDPNQNCSFSIRSLADSVVRNGRVEKNLIRIITWDMVNDPGLDKASKYHSMSLESYEMENDVYFDIPQVMQEVKQRQDTGIALESDDALLSFLLSLESVSAKPATTSWMALKR